MKKIMASLKRSDSKNLIELIVVLLTIGLFLAYKLTFLKFRLGDGNAYFYMSQQILKGDLPYRDFLLADPPLLPYLLALIKLFIGSKIILFQALPAILEAAAAFIFYLLVKQKKYFLKAAAPAIYLGSFLIFSTSDFVSGLHFVNLFILLALLTTKKKPILSGIFWAMASLIKLYVIPGLFGWLLYQFFINKDLGETKKIIIGYMGTIGTALLPFLILSFEKVISQIIIHQFNRPAGLDKTHVLSFFLKKDWLVLSISTVGLFFSKKWKIILPYICWLLFFLIFKDLYYLYLGVLAPWISWSIFELFGLLKKKWKKQDLGKNLSIITLVFLLLNSILTINHYHQEFRLRDIISQIEEVVTFIKKQKPNYPLYGKHESTPLIALLADKKLFNNHIDTNAQLFSSGVLNKDTISQQAVENGIYFINQVANIPQNTNIDAGYEELFNEKLFEKYCQRLQIFDGSGRQLFTDLAVYRCDKQ
ncbi:MAG: hypothetical protein U9O78_03650 [Patescibacteria group bacterium]|nr:hypothetical protein [Patescibacteria group bacterium]